MATEAQLARLNELVTDLKGLSPEELAENPRWGAINFKDVLVALRQIMSLSNHLFELPVAIVPDAPMSGIVQAVEAASQAVARIRAFDLQKSANPRDEREAIAQNIRTASENLLVASQGWIPFLAYQRGDVQKNIAELSQAVVDARGALDKAKEVIEEKKTELDSIIVAAREASASVGVGHFTSDFAGEATRLQRVARDWLRLTAGMAGVTLVLALVLTFIGLPADASNARLAQFLSSKIIILVLMLSATLWCGRIYKATKHQEATNHHRANALKTFQAFSKAASDDATRDAVLLETTRSIFAISPTGYLEGEPGMEPASKMLEIIRSPTKPA